MVRAPTRTMSVNLFGLNVLFVSHLMFSFMMEILKSAPSLTG